MGWLLAFAIIAIAVAALVGGAVLPRGQPSHERHLGPRPPHPCQVFQEDQQARGGVTRMSHLSRRTFL